MGDQAVRSGSVATAQGRFTIDEAGPPDGTLVLLLHGFPQSRHAWRHQLPVLAAGGHHAVAPDQRGYSPGVRPDPADLAAYGIDRLVDDVFDLADALGAERFHLVGHDWGGQVAWVAAGRRPERIRSLAVLSRPHPAAFARAVADDAGGQRHRSRHHRAFDDPATAGRLLADEARRLRTLLGDQGVPPDALEGYLSVLGDPAALEAALAWYRAAAGMGAVPVGPIEVPTLYLWGDADATVSPQAAAWTADEVAGPYRFEALAGVGHFSTDQAPDRVAALLVEHLART